MPRLAGVASSHPGRSEGEGASSAGDKLLDLLDVLVADGPGLQLTQIAARSGLPKSTTVRLLRILERRGYVVRATDDRYFVGQQALILGQQVLTGSHLRNLALPFLIHLASSLNDAANLVVPRWPSILYFERIIPPRLHATFSPPGKLTYFHATASGKAIAAFQSLDTLEPLLQPPLESMTERTIVDPAMLREELARVRERGWASDDGELRVGVRCIAAPVRDVTGHIVASIGISSTQSRGVTDPGIVREVMDAAASLSGLLGYS